MPAESTPTNDERAATQRRIADAIRSVDDDAADYYIRVILRFTEPSLRTTAEIAALGALAACARCPAILDAVRQCAQVHELERGGR